MLSKGLAGRVQFSNGTEAVVFESIRASERFILLCFSLGTLN